MPREVAVRNLLHEQAAAFLALADSASPHGMKKLSPISIKANGYMFAVGVAGTGTFFSIWNGTPHTYRYFTARANAFCSRSTHFFCATVRRSLPSLGFVYTASRPNAVLGGGAQWPCADTVGAHSGRAP